MNPILAYIKASRWQNLALIALSMILLREAVIYTYFELLRSGIPHEVEGGLSTLDFSLLVVASMLIAAAGNLINDYFDIKIDRVNKPDRILVGRYIKRRVAMMSHLVFNGIALLIAGYLSFKTGVIELIFVFVILIATLWFYSTDFKRRLVWGNTAIAFCVALIPLVVWIFEILSMITRNEGLFADQPEARALFMEYAMITLSWAGGLSVFSFLMTFAREITKDVVDMKGDAAFGCKTFPIVFGIGKTKVILVIFYLIVTIMAGLVYYFYVPDNKTLFYFVLILGPLLGATAVTAWTAKEKNRFALSSRLNKITSLIGICYLVIVYLELAQG